MLAIIWVTFVGANLVRVRAEGTLRLPLKDYAKKDWKKKEGSVLCWWSADSVGAKERNVGRFSVAPTVVQVAGSGALLFRLHYATRAKDTCDTVPENVNSS